MVVLLLGWWKTSILLVCRWGTGRMVVCERWLGERRAKVAVIVLRWLLVVGNALLSVLGVLRLLSRRAVVVRSNGRFLHCDDLD